MDKKVKEISKDGNDLIVKYIDTSFQRFYELPENVLDYLVNLQSANDTCGELQQRIDVVSKRIGDFRLFFDIDGKMIYGADFIMVKLRYYRALLDGKIPLTMTAYEYSMWEKENRKGDNK